MTRVSVLLPYRDAASTLAPALESVLAENIVDEVIAIDDGSRDDGFERAQRVRDARVLHLRTGGVGIARALQRGLDLSRGELIARMDADDISLPGRIAAEVALLSRDASLAVASCQCEPFGAVTDGMRSYIAWQNGIVTAEDHAHAIFVEAPMCHPSVTIRRTALESAGGFRDTPWAEDYDLWLRLDAAGHRFAKVDEMLFRWRQHEASVTRRDVRCSIERMRAARAHYLAPRLRGMKRPIAIWGAGPTGKRLARELEKHGVITSRFVDIDARKIGRTRRGVPVVDREQLDRAHTVVIAVGVRGARELVRADLVSRGFIEGRDFVAAA